MTVTMYRLITDKGVTRVPNNDFRRIKKRVLAILPD